MSLKVNKNALLTIVFLLFTTAVTFAEESVIEKGETAINRGVDKTKSSYSATKDKACEMNNGKMKCVGKKLKHKAENIQDKIETESTDIKNKVD